MGIFHFLGLSAAAGLTISAKKVFKGDTILAGVAKPTNIHIYIHENQMYARMEITQAAVRV